MITLENLALTWVVYIWPNLCQVGNTDKMVYAMIEHFPLYLSAYKPKETLQFSVQHCQYQQGGIYLEVLLCIGVWGMGRVVASE